MGETTGEFGELVYRQKKRVLMSLFPGEMRTLAWHLGSLAEQDRYGRDLTLGGLERALVEVTAYLPVYRTYICSCRVSVRERRIIERTVAAAKKRLPDGAFALDFLRRVILLEFPDTLPVAQRQKWLDFVRSWQLYTGPAMAKGFEDTALYLYNRLISLNEVGGNPACEGVTVAEFHRANEGRQKRHPHTLNATSTHDTKRGEDVRARINVLSELSGVWSVLVRRWSSWNLPRKPVVDGLPVPDPAGEMLIYQTLVGAWPLQEEDFPSFRDRLETYSVKAAREAKLHTSWLNPREAYERALREFISAILESSPGNPFLLDFLEFQRTCAYFGALNALSQVLLKIASPGVPDFYQGTELWSFSLVDPDNRRPVDFRKRVSLLDSLQKEEAGGRADLARKLLANWKDGRVKLYLTYKALHLRRSLGRLFENGVYVPVGVAGARYGHVCAFIRRLENNWVLAAAPRLVARLMAAGLELEPGNKKTNGPLFPYLTGEGTMQPVTRGSRKLSPCQPAPAADRDLETKLTGGPVPDVLLPPVRLWEDTTLLLPEQAPDRWLNIFTDEEITIVRGGTGAIPPGCKTLPLARLLASFPVALLIPVRSGTSS
ncbi:MAG: Maltooligosyl trehalose synthase [Firmicutes bacterium ADurb.Bin456]|nr:MAG: Maltooligosyl trehalose synthase [Firmicutes bacterium ADurb.Bin456]